MARSTVLSVIILISLFLVIHSANAQNINTPENFPDPNFKAYVEKYMGVDPGGEFTASEAAAMTKDFDCSRKEINDLTGIEYFSNLHTLYCPDNHLMILDLSSNTALTYLHCDNNQLIVLNLSSNIYLTFLTCRNNQLSELDVSSNRTLRELSCGHNPLTELNISTNTVLTKLFCTNNKLKELDVSANKSLTELWYVKNQLTKLDLSSNTALKRLTCSTNNLTELDLSSNTSLTFLSCENNQITKLDISPNTALETLYCSDNQLTTLNISFNKSLICLGCQNNPLKKLDLSSNTALIDLYCDNNQLTELDLSSNTSLTNLYCVGNQLTKLNMSSNTTLQGLYCAYNQLMELDLFFNTTLNQLNCSNNQLTELEFSHNTTLSWLYCKNNQIKDISSLVSLSRLISADVRNNNLDYGDWPNAQSLINRLGDPVFRNDVLQHGFACSPQNNLDPYELKDTNIARFGVATASSYRYGRTPSNAIDGDTTTLENGWSAEGDSGWWQLKLPYELPIYRIDLYPSINNLHDMFYEYSIVISSTGVFNGEEQEIVNETARERVECITYFFEPVQTKYIRLIPKDKHPYAILQEFKVYIQGDLPEDFFDHFSINTVQNFPDPNFKNCVEKFMGVAPGGDFTAAEAAAKTGAFDCHEKGISDLSGIEYFSKLQSLSCFSNHLTTLDLSANTALESLFCYNNNLTILDVSASTILKSLYCNDNQLTHLDVSNNTILTNLDCRNNHIQDISSFVSLANLVLVDVTNNNLDYSDWPYVQSLINKVGNPVFVWDPGYGYWLQSGFSYSPQNHFKPYENQNINTVEYFPDPNFKAYVEEYMGVDPGEEFTTVEAAAKTDYFSCVGKDINDISGIEYFVNLTHLNCSRNNLIAIDISKNTALTKLLCFQNQIKILDVKHNTALTSLDCSNNKFTELDVSHNTALTYLNCGWSQLTELDITNNPVLTDLQCRWSKLTDLDVSTNQALEILYCIGNHIRELYQLPLILVQEPRFTC
jgi:Leucine-rich repeat (LRR) protein